VYKFGGNMEKKQLIKIMGRWNYFRWWFMNIVLKKKVCYGISLECNYGKWIREFIDHEGNLKYMELN
jgi:hypothetical protein